jgi:hypothetical protein
MLRLKNPCGKVDAATYKCIDDLSEKYGQKDLRATTRQAFQVSLSPSLPPSIPLSLCHSLPFCFSFSLFLSLSSLSLGQQDLRATTSPRLYLDRKLLFTCKSL